MHEHLQPSLRWLGGVEVGWGDLGGGRSPTGWGHQQAEPARARTRDRWRRPRRVSGRRGGGAGRCPGRLGLGPTFRMGRGRRQRQRRGRDAGPSPPGRAGAGAKRERLPEPEQKQEHHGAEPLQSRAGPEPDSACLCPCPCLCPCLGLEHCRRERAACNHPCNRVRRAGGNPNPGRPWPGLERASSLRFAGDTVGRGLVPGGGASLDGIGGGGGRRTRSSRS